MVLHLQDTYRIGKDGPIEAALEQGQLRCYEMLIEEEQASRQEPKFGNEERDEVKRKIVYILGIRVRLACLSIYGGRGSLNRKYKASTPSPTLLAIPLRLWSSGPISAECSDPIRGFGIGSCRPCLLIQLYTLPSRYIPSSC